MSNILAIDCCLRLTGTALMLNGEVVDSMQDDLGRRQSQELPLMAESLLRRQNLAWDSLDYVALTNGPGYFTGVRVGAAYASGVAYASGAKVIPVSSLEMLSAGSGHRKPLAVVYAGHGYVYAWCDGSLDAGEYTLESIHEWRSQNPDTIVVSDDPERAGVIDALQVRPSMKALCELAVKRTSQAVSPLELKINYYRAPQGVK